MLKQLSKKKPWVQTTMSTKQPWVQNNHGYKTTGNPTSTCLDKFEYPHSLFAEQCHDI